MSNCVCLQTLDLDKAKAHFLRMGLTVVDEGEDEMELSDGNVRLFIDRGPEMGPIMELIVMDLEMAKEDLTSQGWSVVLWEGKGKRCYLRNPNGVLFNLFEDASAFDEEVNSEGGI